MTKSIKNKQIELLEMKKIIIENGHSKDWLSKLDTTKEKISKWEVLSEEIMHHTLQGDKEMENIQEGLGNM